MLPGLVGSKWIPRKIAGIAMITIDVSIVAIIMLRVVLDRAIHLYLPPAPLSPPLTARTLARLKIRAATAQHPFLGHSRPLERRCGPSDRAPPARADQHRQVRADRLDGGTVVSERDPRADLLACEHQRQPVPGVVPHAVERQLVNPEPARDQLV